MSRRFRCGWLPLRQAFGFVARHHRHHEPPQGAIAALGLWEADDLVGVSVIARPVSRVLQAQGVIEITRLCTVEGLEGIGEHANAAASTLYARSRRLAAAFGFQRIVTYTLASERGSSLLGDGWQPDLALAGGGEWDRPSRRREVARHPTEPKRRWWHDLDAQPDLVLAAISRR